MVTRNNNRYQRNGRSHAPGAAQAAYSPQSRGSSQNRYAAVGGFTPAEQRKYRDYNRYLQKQPKKRRVVPFLIFLAVLIAIGVGAFLYMEFRPFSVNVNGTTYELQGKHTIDSIVQDGLATPKSGDLLAIDGSVYEEGKGNGYEVVVNGSDEPNHERRLTGGEVVVINDGTDVTEPIKETTETIPFNTVEKGKGPIHRVMEGVEGTVLIRTGSLSGIEQREQVAAPQDKTYLKYYPDTGGDKVIALTLDDGPWGETTEEILNILAENNVKATFFTIGEQIDSSDYNQALVKRAFDEGHQVCTHSYDHAKGSGQGVNLGYMTAEEQINEVKTGLEAIKNATGQDPSTVFRAPGGNYSSETEKILEPYISSEIGWTVDTNDWRKPGVDALVSSITSGASSGGVILMHDGGGDRSQTVAALRQALPYLKQQGYTFVTMDQLLAYPPASD